MFCRQLRLCSPHIPVHVRTVTVVPEDHQTHTSHTWLLLSYCMYLSINHIHVHLAQDLVMVPNATTGLNVAIQSAGLQAGEALYMLNIGCDKDGDKCRIVSWVL